MRFADEVAGDPLIDFAERGDQTEVATFPGEPYSSYFSGNVVQICPVGALTAKPYRFKARPWDLEQVESTCTTCAVGCRVAVQSSSGELTRLIGVDSDPVNWGWLCDKGRFDFAAGDEPRPAVGARWSARATSWSRPAGPRPWPWPPTGLAAARSAGGGSALAVIGGARLPNEDAYAWAKAARVALRHRQRRRPARRRPARPRPSSACPGPPSTRRPRPPLVITLGPDIKDELPVLYLRLRDAVRENGHADRRADPGAHRPVAATRPRPSPTARARWPPWPRRWPARRR